MLKYVYVKERRINMAEQRTPATFTIKSELHEKLQKLAKDTRIPMSRLVDEALEDLYEKYEKKE